MERILCKIQVTIADAPRVAIGSEILFGSRTDHVNDTDDSFFSMATNSLDYLKFIAQLHLVPNFTKL